MRRIALISLTAVAAVALLAGCGAEGVVSPTPVKVIGSLPKPTLEPITPAFKLKGNPAAGKATFLKAGCVGCHTLADAGATGTVGPNLDQLKPPYDKIVHQVEVGGGPMPAFKGTLTAKQIQDVSAFVFASTHA